MAAAVATTTNTSTPMGAPAEPGPSTRPEATHATRDDYDDNNVEVDSSEYLSAHLSDWPPSCDWQMPHLNTPPVQALEDHLKFVLDPFI